MSAVSVLTWIAPLCPAGHLPHKGGDRDAAPSQAPTKRRACGYEWDFRRYASLRVLLHSQVSMWTETAAAWSISPLEGEMPGRAEGGETLTTAPTSGDTS